jgi:hypothetical protein
MTTVEKVNVGSALKFRLLVAGSLRQTTSSLNLLYKVRATRSLELSFLNEIDALQCLSLLSSLNLII